MPATHQNSTQYAAQHVTSPPTIVYPTEAQGILRAAYFQHDQDGAGDATSSVALAKLPPGRVRLFLGLSRMWCNWTTGSATLDLGWDAYTNSLGSTVNADVDGLIDGLSVDTAGYFNMEGALAGIRLLGGTYLFESKSGVVIRASSTDVAIVSGDDLAGYLIYNQD